MSESQQMKDIQQIGLSDESRGILTSLVEAEYFKSQIDAIRTAVAVAIQHGCAPDINSSSGRTTSHHLASVDEDKSIQLVISEVYPDCAGTTGRALEDLAEQGLKIVNLRYGGSDDFRLTSLLDSVPG